MFFFYINKSKAIEIKQQFILKVMQPCVKVSCAAECGWLQDVHVFPIHSCIYGGPQIEFSVWVLPCSPSLCSERTCAPHTFFFKYNHLIDFEHVTTHFSELSLNEPRRHTRLLCCDPNQSHG